MSLTWTTVKDRLAQEQRRTGSCNVILVLAGGGKVTGRVTEENPVRTWVEGEVVIQARTGMREVVETHYVSLDSVAVLTVVS